MLETLLDATGSFDPDQIAEELFNGIASLQWDLGADGIDPEDAGLINPMQRLSLTQALDKALAIGAPVPLPLSVVDADGLLLMAGALGGGRSRRRRSVAIAERQKKNHRSQHDGVGGGGTSRRGE